MGKRNILEGRIVYLSLPFQTVKDRDDHGTGRIDIDTEEILFHAPQKAVSVGIDDILVEPVIGMDILKGQSGDDLLKAAATLKNDGMGGRSCGDIKGVRV